MKINNYLNKKYHFIFLNYIPIFIKMNVFIIIYYIVYTSYNNFIK